MVLPTSAADPRPRLKTALVRRGHTQPLMDGTVARQGLEFDIEDVPDIIAVFRRMVRGLEFDVSEMAMTTYLCARAHGKRFTAIPVFPRRAFFHTNFACHADAPIDGPRDLAHKRIGVAEYVQSATLWARGVLEHDFGLDPRKA